MSPWPDNPTLAEVDRRISYLLRDLENLKAIRAPLWKAHVAARAATRSGDPKKETDA